MTGSQNHVKMGTPGCPYLRGVHIFMTPGQTAPVAPPLPPLSVALVVGNPFEWVVGNPFEWVVGNPFEWMVGNPFEWMGSKQSIPVWLPLLALLLDKHENKS